MSAQIADFQLKFTADSAQFNKDVEAAKKMLRGYATEAVAANDSNASFADALEKSADQAKNFRRGLIEVAGAVTATIGSFTAATGYLITSQADQARELQRMATVSGETIASIQALSYASEQYGISGEKMSDILKDVNDKLGDYAQTGGGEFADFFDNILPKVGLTSAALQQMSGPDALIAVKNAMDEANVPLKDQIFYLESVANDASALMPLLDNQGQKLYELKEHYDRLNVAMSDYDIEQFKQMDQQLTDSGLKVQRAFANAVVGSKEQIDWLTQYLVNAIHYWGTLFDSWADNPKTADGLADRLYKLRSELKEVNKDLAKTTSELKEYQGIDSRSLPSINPFGKSRNEQFNLTANYALLTSKKAELEAQIDKFQAEYGRVRFGATDPNADNTPPPVGGGSGQFDYPDKTTYDDSKLASLDMQYADETGKLRLAHEQRLAAIESYNISAEELEARGYDSLSALQQDYAAQENAFYTAQLNERQVKRENELNKKLESFQTEVEAMQVQAAQQMAITAAGDDAQAAQEDAAYQNRLIKLRDHFNDAYIAAGENDAAKLELNKQYLDAEEALFNEHQSNLTQIAKTAAEKRAQDEEKTRSMQFSGVSSFFGQMAQLQTSENKKAASAGKAFARANILMNTYEMATKAYNSMVGIPYVGPVLATAAAGAAVGFGMAQYNAVGMAHDGIDTVPQEGTWLLNTGERVYTNESVAKLDQMYSAIMSLYSAISSVKVANDSTYNVKGSNAQGAIVNIYQAPEGTYAKQSVNEDGRQQIDVFCQDMNEGGEMAQAISTRFDLPIKGSL